MLKREFKINFKNFLIWTLILIVLFLVIFLIYPSILKSDNIKMLDEMMKLFPKEMLKAFNMDISSIDSAFGFLKTEGFIFILLLTGIYSSMLGANILLKEESDKTIEYLNSLPVKRRCIVLNKVICAISYIILMVLIIAIFNYIGLELSGNFDKKQYILLSITPMFSALPLFSINLFISTFSKKTRQTTGLSLGIALGSYFLQILSDISEVTEFLKYFTVYTLPDIRNVIVNISINPVIVVLSFIITFVFILGTFIKYENKELM